MFKLPNKSTHAGTNSHKSALKMVQPVSPVKRTYEEAFAKRSDRYKDMNLADYTTEAKRQNEVYAKTGKWDVKKSYAKSAPKVEKKISAGSGDPQADLDKSVKAKEVKSKESNVKVLTKDQLKDKQMKSEAVENKTVKDAKDSRKYTKETFGKGSAEHATAKVEVSKAKGKDMAGAKGGKKATVLGKLRRKLNAKKTERLEKKAIKKGKEKDDALARSTTKSKANPRDLSGGVGKADAKGKDLKADARK
jgi:hypothetical protein